MGTVMVALHPSEPKAYRENPQAAMPGEVIQDPEDGQPSQKPNGSLGPNGAASPMLVACGDTPENPCGEGRGWRLLWRGWCSRTGVRT